MPNKKDKYKKTGYKKGGSVPKPKKKPMTPKEAKRLEESLKSADRANKGDMAILKKSKKKMKCGGKVKK